MFCVRACGAATQAAMTHRPPPDLVPERRMIPLRTFTCLALLVTVPVPAQGRRTRVRVAVGAVRQGSPTTTEAGTTALLAVELPVSRSLSLVPEAEHSRTHVLSNISTCYFVDVAGNCLHRTHSESLVALGGSLDWHPLRGTLLRPHVAAGVARVWSGSGPNAGESASFLAPQANAGLTLGRSPALSIDLRVRRLDRWGRLPASGQGALLVGLSFRANRSCASPRKSRVPSACSSGASGPCRRSMYFPARSSPTG